MDNDYQTALKVLVQWETFMEDCADEHKVPIEVVRRIAMHTVLMHHLVARQS